jgi:uncharacterized protein YjbI with pentapeptide repeats
MEEMRITSLNWVKVLLKPDRQLRFGATMQDAFSTLLQLETQNHYPACLGMELTLQPVQSDSPDSHSVELYLTLEFDEQWQLLLGGRVKFGIKGGELHLELDSSTRVVGQFDDPLPLPSSDLPSLRVTVRSPSATALVWAFTVEGSEPILKGAIASWKLATLEMPEKPERLTARFVVGQTDVSLTDAEGLWKHDISPNKHAILERKLARSLWEHRLKPYLSTAQLSYRALEPNPEANPTHEEAILRLPELQPIIDRLSAANTDNFLELAAIANLDPTRDFAGGNLLAANLSGLDFSGANLSQANFRGADLSDADLSEADLSGAKLRGADLSGAYLGNANLSNADLLRASLALANLGGANLSGANLSEANLSSANLGHANVEGATFGQNPGLTEELKLHLQQRGAMIRES